MIKPVKKRDKEAFNKAAGHPLQSWEWGEFRKSTGNEVVRLGVFKGNKLTDAIQVVFSHIPNTSFKIGTVIKGPKPTKEILEALKDLAKEENVIFTAKQQTLFIKLEPNFPNLYDFENINI